MVFLYMAYLIKGEEMSRKGRATPMIVRVFDRTNLVDSMSFPSIYLTMKFLRSNNCRFSDALFRETQGNMLEFTSGHYFYEVEEDLIPSACCKVKK